MVINGSDKIKDDDGDYIVLTDYGCEGFSVLSQSETPNEAIESMTHNNYGSPQVLVKLVRLDVADADPSNASGDSEQKQPKEIK